MIGKKNTMEVNETSNWLLIFF